MPSYSSFQRFLLRLTSGTSSRFVYLSLPLLLTTFVNKHYYIALDILYHLILQAYFPSFSYTTHCFNMSYRGGRGGGRGGGQRGGNRGGGFQSSGSFRSVFLYKAEDHTDLTGKMDRSIQSAQQYRSLRTRHSTRV